MRAHSILLAGVALLLGGEAIAQNYYRPNYRVLRKIAFSERDGRPLELDLYLPRAEGPHPIGVVIHGGGWHRGSRAGPDAAAMCRLLLEKGIAAASISYSLVPRAVWPAQIEDCRRAVQFLRHHAERYDLDPTRVAAVGASAGGHLAALLGTMDDAADPEASDPVSRESSRVRCVVSFFGPTSLLPHPTASRKAVRLVKALLGGGDEDDPEALARARAASPLHHLDRGDAPTIFVHGEADHLVPFWQSQAMFEAMRRLGIPAELVRVPRGDHGDFVIGALLRHEQQEKDFWVRPQRFLLRHLGIEDAAAAEASVSRASGSPGDDGPGESGGQR